MDVKRSELKKWARTHMKGVENAIYPSFTPDLSQLDEASIRWDVQQSIRHGFFSTLVATETGLTFDEAKRFVQIVAEEAGGKILVTTTLLLDSFEQNMAMLEHAERVGCHGVLFGYPHNYYPTDEEQIFRVTREMCESTNLAVVLYPSPHFNFQRLHPSGFPLDALSRMADLENVIAVKVGEPGLMAECARRLGSRILVACPVERFLPLMVLGFGQQWLGAGCYEVFQSPEKPYLVEYFRLLRDGKVDAAMEIYWKLTPARVIFEQQFMPQTMLGTYNWTQHKFYQWCVGGAGGLTRQPALKIHQHEIETTKMAYRMIGIDPREPDEEFYVGRLAYAKRRSAQERAEAVRVDVSSLTFADKDDRATSLASLKGDLVVLFGGGKGAAEEGKRWGQALDKARRERNGLRFFETAFVGKLPVFAPRKMIKKTIVDAATAPTLFDWDGQPGQALGLADPNTPHVFVIDRDGYLRFKLAGACSDANLRQVIDRIDELR